MSISPFLFEMFLAEKIEGGQSHKVTFGPNHVTFSLKKSVPEVEWKTIEVCDLDRDQKQLRRTEAEQEERHWFKEHDAATKGAFMRVYHSGN
jgi:hypothetical protein